MSKERKTETEKEVKETKVEKYFLTENVKLQGYFAEIDGRKFYVSRAERVNGINESGKTTRIIKPGVVLEPQEVEIYEGKYQTQLTPTNKNYFENLNFEQKRILLSAKVITLSKAQEASFKKEMTEYFNKLHAYRNE
jgi:hypothetical protein